MSNCTTGGITCSPTLARAGVRHVPIRTQRTTINPSVGDGVDYLLPRATQHCRHDGRRGDAYEDDVIEPHAVEAVFEREHALNLVSLDHPSEHVAHGGRGLAFHHSLAGEVVSYRENTAEIIGRVTPFGCQPSVIEVQPTDHCADVEGCLDGVQLVRGAGHARATCHHSTGDHGSHELGARRVLQCLKAAGEGIHQAVPCGLVRLGT